MIENIVEDSDPSMSLFLKQILGSLKGHLSFLIADFGLFCSCLQRGNQKISKTAAAIVSVAWLSAAVCVFVAIPKHSWFWLISCFK